MTLFSISVQMLFHFDLIGCCPISRGALPYKRVQDVLFFRVLFFSINSETGYDYLFKNNRLLFSRTIDYCFPYCFGIFCNLIIPKQGIEMPIFFLNGLWRFLTNGHLPVNLHSSAPRVRYLIIWQGRTDIGRSVLLFPPKI